MQDTNNIENFEKMIVAIIGYRRTGKDTLFKILNKEIENYEKWSLYSELECEKHYIFDKQYNRIALAESLKERICKLNSIKYIEEEKDLKNIEIDNILYSFRDLCIQYANSNDPLIWIKKVLKIIQKDNKNYMITDLRLLHELKMLEDLENFVSIRIFDGLKEIPCENIKSEHELDSYRTDFLLLRNTNLQNFLVLFPQYSNFNNCMKLV